MEPTFSDLKKRSDLILRPNFGLRSNLHKFSYVVFSGLFLSIVMLPTVFLFKNLVNYNMNKISITLQSQNPVIFQL